MIPQLKPNDKVKYRQKWLRQFKSKPQLTGTIVSMESESFYPNRNWFNPPIDITLFKIQWDNNTQTIEYACNLQPIKVKQ